MDQLVAVIRKEKKCCILQLNLVRLPHLLPPTVYVQLLAKSKEKRKKEEKQEQGKIREQEEWQWNLVC
jgi:hypothetical protein